MSWGHADARGASSVVGVLLLIAVTVILAAVVATFTLDLGSESTNDTPKVNWEYEYNSGKIQATHASGDDVKSDALKIQGSCATDPPSPPSTISSGDTITIGNGSCTTSGENIKIIWTDPVSDNSAILGEFSN